MTTPFDFIPDFIRLRNLGAEVWLFHTYSRWNCHIRLNLEKEGINLEIKKSDDDIYVVVRAALDAFDRSSQSGLPNHYLSPPIDTTIAPPIDDTSNETF